MRPYKTSFDQTEVDLDNPETYRQLSTDTKELDDLMFKEIGYALCYMNNFYPDMFPQKKKYMMNPYTNKKQLDCGYTQRQRVMKLIENFCNERKNHYSDVLWLQEQLFLLDDETENMC